MHDLPCLEHIYALISPSVSFVSTYHSVNDMESLQDVRTTAVYCCETILSVPYTGIQQRAGPARDRIPVKETPLLSTRYTAHTLQHLKGDFRGDKPE